MSVQVWDAARQILRYREFGREAGSSVRINSVHGSLRRIHVLSCRAIACHDDVQDTIELISLSFIRFIGHKRDVWVVLHGSHPR